MNTPTTTTPVGGSLTRLVRRVDRSPMNPLRWCCELDCGHEVWVTSKSRPTRAKMKCPTCITPNTEVSSGAKD